MNKVSLASGTRQAIVECQPGMLDKHVAQEIRGERRNDELSRLVSTQLEVLADPRSGKGVATFCIVTL